MGLPWVTVRNWLELLIVPMVLVGIGLLFEMRQADRQEATEKQQQELAEQRAQDEALQAYLNQMSQLMLERKLLETEPGTPLYTLAQARTSTVILRLDAEHNASVIRFLSDSGLAWSKAGSVTTFAIAPDSGARRLPPSVFL
jgi:type II secretory pathway pseudopilin PulG